MPFSTTLTMGLTITRGVSGSLDSTPKKNFNLTINHSKAPFRPCIMTSGTVLPSGIRTRSPSILSS
jgi:hypothetical protein